MNQQAIQILSEIIERWKGSRRFTFENKKIDSYKSPITNDEFVLRFTNSVNSFLCNGVLIPINLVSRPFLTNTISDNPLSQNKNADKYRLEKFLEEFDEQFYKELETKLENCIETLTTSDPLFF
jgi:hypothetical protein